MEKITYTKVLKSRYSPKNKCYVPDGEVLTIIAPDKLPHGDKIYFFVGALSEEKSRYGWVSEIDEFSLDDFINKYAFNKSNEVEKEYIKILLDAVAKKPINTPMAASFASRGASVKRTVLTVHKVFFYDISDSS